MLGRCQICGRRKGQRKAGGMVRHYVRGDPCPGEGHPPIEESDARLVELIASIRADERAVLAQLKDLRDRRVNWIDPAIEARRWALLARADKLERRLKRNRSWPARFVREMERDGWGTRPPAYLISRYIEEQGWTHPLFR